MTHPPTSCASGLSRKSTGLTEAHRELIFLLAYRAVDDYLREVEAMDEPADRRMAEAKGPT